MAFKELSVVQVREVLRRWLHGDGMRRAASAAGVDRKTARGIVERACALGLVREGGFGQLTDALVMAVGAAGAPGNPRERGETWRRGEAHREFLAEKLAAGLTLTKTQELLVRHTGEPMPYRTLHRFATRELGFSQQAPTVRVDDCAPGHEVQVDFGRMGMLTDTTDGSRRAVWALIFTAVYSRHMFVWLAHGLDLQAVIAGCEAAWRAFGGVFRIVVPDNLKPAVTTADRLNPRISDDFLAHAQARGFEADPTRVRSPKDKPRVERTVRYTRDSFWAGETSGSLAEAQAAAEAWCERVGRRLHGTEASGLGTRGASGASASPTSADKGLQALDEIHPRRPGPQVGQIERVFEDIVQRDDVIQIRRAVGIEFHQDQILGGGDGHLAVEDRQTGGPGEDTFRECVVRKEQIDTHAADAAGGTPQPNEPSRGERADLRVVPGEPVGRGDRKQRGKPIKGERDNEVDVPREARSGSQHHRRAADQGIRASESLHQGDGLAQGRRMGLSHRPVPSVRQRSFNVHSRRQSASDAASASGPSNRPIARANSKSAAAACKRSSGVVRSADSTCCFRRRAANAARFSGRMASLMPITITGLTAPHTPRGRRPRTPRGGCAPGRRASCWARRGSLRRAPARRAVRA